MKASGAKDGEDTVDAVKALKIKAELLDYIVDEGGSGAPIGNVGVVFVAAKKFKVERIG